jgi:hypothetical protein
MFVKAPLRVQKFKQLAPSLPLPPQPVLTRWGTWLDAAEYYCENCAGIEEIVNTFDSSDAFSITIIKELFSSKLSVILTVHSIAIVSYLFIILTHAQFYNIITSPLYVFRHSECHPQGVTVLKA